MDASERSARDSGRRQQPPDDALPSPWGRIALPEGRTLYRRIGPLELWLRRVEGEIRVASGQAGEEASGPAGAPSDDEHRTEETAPETAAWSRWAAPEAIDAVHLRPVFPDRQVVVEPEVPFALLPSAEAKVFVRVPLSVRVTTGSPDDPITLIEIPTVALSDTWWGDFLDGELSYWLHTTARRRMDPSLLQPYRAICPLLLSNRSAAELKVEKLTLRVAGLSLFKGGEGVGGLWADTSRVRYLGDSEGSQIEMSGRAPEEAGDARRVCPPLQPLPRGLKARTFARLRSLPGVG